MTKIFYMIISGAVFFSCGEQKHQKDNETTEKGNISTTISTDTSKLAKLIDIHKYKPTQVKFKYTFIDNSGKNERLPVPGPSDSYLEAILYFDTATFKDLKTKYFNADHLSTSFDKENFNFEWLDNDIKTALLKSDTSYHGLPDYFFGSGPHGKLWLLDNKLLLTKSTD
jgi:hypothetical protein